MKKISRNHPPAKISDSKIPRGQRLVMGLHAVGEAVKLRPSTARRLWLKKGYEENPTLKGLAQWAEKRRLPLDVVSMETLNKYTAGHQGVGLLLDDLPDWDAQVLEAEESATVLLLDGIEDPHNLGAIIRTAWLMGVKAVFATAHRSAGLTPTVYKVASGGVEHVPIVFESSLSQVCEDLKKMGFWVYGLAAEGEGTIYDLKMDAKVAWILGSEESGLKKPVSRACDTLVSIPQTAKEASFNVSVAAALALGETFRQQRYPQA